MADLSKALKNYCTYFKSKATLHGFVNNDESHKELVITWFEIYATYDDAMSNLMRKFKTVYKECTKKSYKSKTILDLSALFSQSQLNKSVTNSTANKIILRLKIPQTAPTGYNTASSSSLICTSSTGVEFNASPSSAGLARNEPSSSSSSLPAPRSTEAELNNYIEMCKDKANKHGFNLQTEINQVLASKGILLLKKNQLCSKLVRCVDAASLHNKIQSDAINKDIKVDTEIYVKLVKLLRDINDRTDRRALKTELNKLYEKATKEDGMIIETFVNLVTKAPKFERLSPVGELELTVNFLDPILSHVFHCPDLNKHLIWLNRKDDNTTSSRPDAAMMVLPQRADDVTLGYVEVKPSDIQANLESAFMDLVRLGTFARSLMLRKANRKVLVVQCIGYTMVFYLISEHLDGITFMTGLLTIVAPKEIAEISGLLQKVDDLKRLFLFYDQHLEDHYANVRVHDDDEASVMEAVNPKRRKTRVPSFSLK